MKKRLMQKMLMTVFSIQMFADGAGNVVNATGNYVNAYTGETETFSGSNTLAPEMKTFYDTELLENAKPLMIHAQFGRRQSIPKGRGKTIEWRKFNTLPNADVLTEGVIPTGKKLGVSTLTDEVIQCGMYVSVSDMLEMTALDNTILEAQVELNASAGRSQDEMTRNDMVAGTNVLYAQKIVSNVLTDVTSRAGLDATAKLTADTVARAATCLKKMNAPKINGDYVAIIHPSVTYDLRSDPAWIDVHKYAATTEIFNGEIGKLHGVRFVETTEAKIIKGKDLASDSRTLAVNGAVTAATQKTITFDGGTVAANALKDRKIIVDGKLYEVASNTDTVITVKGSDNLPAIADNTVIYPGEGGSAGLAVYCTLFLGKEAYGVVDIEGGALEMIVHPKTDGTGGPLNQFSTIGYKLTTNGAKILYEDRMLRVESCGSYSATDEAN